MILLLLADADIMIDGSESEGDEGVQERLNWKGCSLAIG